VQTIAVQQAEGHLAEIIDKLAPGEEIVLTRDNKPVATIRAAPTSGDPPRFGTLRGSILYITPDFDAIPEGFEDYLPGGCCSTRTPCSGRSKTRRRGARRR
jgi:antitoxin (DNA-binding transcriptional repressor) of toxin-antitoxin stability system